MKKDNSTGYLSKVLWQGFDLQLQTEIRYAPQPSMTTIMVKDGEVISRIEKPWIAVSEDIEDKKRVNSYHKRLTRAIERLKDKGWIKLEDLPKLAPRIVSVALKFTSGSMTSEALALVPEARWTALASRSGDMLEAAPENKAANNWCESTPKINSLLGKLSDLFDSGPFEDASLKIGEGFIIISGKEKDSLLAAVGSKHLPEARQMLRRLTNK